MATLATANIPGAVINCVQKKDWIHPFEGVFSSKKNLVAFYSGAEEGIEARYVHSGAGRFKPIGEVVIRPSGYQLRARGVGKSLGIECWLDDCRMETFNRAAPYWTTDRLHAALDIRAAGLRDFFLRLQGEVLRPGFAAQSTIEALVVILLNDLAASFADGGARRDRNERGRHIGAITRVVERIMDFAAETPTIGELARVAALNESHLLRVFREEKGKPLTRFIREARIERAKQLLATDLPIKIVAHQLGFSSHSSFTASFTREMGVNPHEFRQSHRRQAFFVKAAR